MSSIGPLRDSYDVIVVGGGFYGCCVALATAQQDRRVLLLERAGDLLTRASYVNQARIHNGYHYPRSLLTALRSAANFPQFKSDFEECVDDSFLQIYAIARSTSKVNAYQFRKFCEHVRIPLRRPPTHIARLFNPALIEEVFCTEECAFDAVKLRFRLEKELRARDVEIRFGCEVDHVAPGVGSSVRVKLEHGAEITGGEIFNCTYSRMNESLVRSNLHPLPLKHEIAEMAIIRVPPPLSRVGITVMDGPFFSMMPFPALGLHSLSHVHYTPHEHWDDRGGLRQMSQTFSFESKFKFMVKDSQRYVPSLSEVEHVRSLFEIKTVLMQNEIDDGRPILCRRDYGFKNHSVILGGKLDNIYDVLQAIGVGELMSRSTNESFC